jgi:hypothetical protein
MELLVSSSSIHASPLLSSPFPSATATPNTDALECPSNATAQEHHPQVALLPRASRCEVSPKPPHVVRHFHREHLVDGRHLWPPLTLTLYGPQADIGDLVSRLPLPFLSGRPAPPWIAPPNRFTKPSWSSSRRSPTGLVTGEQELAGRRLPTSSARLLCSGWASRRNG